MKFKKLYSSREARFIIGLEEESNRYYLAIPVNFGMVDGLEYYVITKEEFDKIFSDFDYLKNLAQKCRERKNDINLFHKPGLDRGEPN